MSSNEIPTMLPEEFYACPYKKGQLLCREQIHCSTQERVNNHYGCKETIVLRGRGIDKYPEGCVAERYVREPRVSKVVKIQPMDHPCKSAADLNYPPNGRK